MRARTSQEMLRCLEDEIEAGRLAPGDRLDEQSLAQRFSVSRTPAREALLQLAASGMVRMVPRRGAIVSGISARMWIGMVEVLTALEAEAAGLAARRMPAAERLRLAEVHRSQEAAVAALDSDRYIAANAAFHDLIYAGARNAYLAEQVRATRRRMRSYQESSLRQPARLKASWQEHAAVVAAIESGEDEAARAAMRDHILSGGRVLADMVAALADDEDR
jgi:DNA-binding GntR family transcriptional regulator